MAYVSVVVPCYNAESYIEKCLRALEAQTFRDFNVILVDDCSKDNTREMIREYCAHSGLVVTLLCNEENMGPAASRNRGVTHSDAAYVCFCDCDDWYDPDYLEQMVNASKDGWADMVLCNSRKVMPNGSSVNLVLIPDMATDSSARQVLALGVDSLCMLMVRRQIAADTPLPDLRNGEDMAVIPLMIMASSRFGFVTKCLYNYWCRPGSLSLSSRSGVAESLERSFAHMITHSRPGFDRELAYIGMKNVVYGGLLNHFKASQDQAAARVLLERFEIQYPGWYKNPYRKNLPMFKQTFLLFAKMRWFAPMRMMSQLHRGLTEGWHRK